MHLQTIVHSVAFFGIENAAAPVSGQPREIHSKARFGLQDESVQGIARGSLPLKASAAQAVAAFFTRVFYHTPGRLSSIFMRFFKKYMGMSCVQYIKNVRLERAADQFENGETNTLEVALACGFSNLSYFHREFKKKYGMTPKRFISLSARAADFHEGSE